MWNLLVRPRGDMTVFHHSRWKSQHLRICTYIITHRNIVSSSVRSCSERGGNDTLKWESVISDSLPVRKSLDKISRLTLACVQRIASVFIEFVITHCSLVRQNSMYPFHPHNSSLPSWIWSHLPMYKINVLTLSDGLKVSCAVGHDMTEGKDTISDVHSSSSAVKREFLYHELVSLARILDCSVDEVKKLVKEQKFFEHLNQDLIQLKVSTMLNFGLSHSFVRENPRLLNQTSASELNKRLKMLKENSLLYDKAVVSMERLGHYLECKNEYFAYVFKKLCAEKEALEGCSDQQNYIQYRLQCSQSEAEALLASYPLERRVTNVKLKRLLDFFLTEISLSPQFVIKQRVLLHFSTKRLRTRWKVMQAAGVKSESALVRGWNISQKKFEKEYQKFLDP